MHPSGRETRRRTAAEVNGATSLTRRRRAARLSLIGAFGVFALKLVAWLATGSVGLLSDAAESTVNVVAALSLVLALRLSRAPPDYEHPYGHEKVEDLSSAFEAGLIMVAALFIAVTASSRLFQPEPIDRVGLGVTVAGASALLNGALSWWLAREGRRLESAALRANARHLATDVLTSLGVIVGVILVATTGLLRLDPIVALVVAAHIGHQGTRVFAHSVSQLLDERLPEEEERVVLAAMKEHPNVLGYHRLRSRRSGRARFVEVDVFVPGELSVRRAHDLVVALENEIHASLPNLVTTIHVEPFEEGVREGATDPRDEFPTGA